MRMVQADVPPYLGQVKEAIGEARASFSDGRCAVRQDVDAVKDPDKCHEAMKC